MLLALVALFTVNSSSQVSPGPSASSSPIESESRSFSAELEQLKARVDQQQQQISRQQGMIKGNAQKREGKSAAVWTTLGVVITALGVVIAALLGGYFAFRNQNAQAEQNRLLKAVELIMESRSGYQADIRTKNLSVFLDDETKKHLENIKTNFSGPEYTDALVGLAEAMSAKAATPVEVLAIWKSVLKEKKFFDQISYPAENKPNA